MLKKVKLVFTLMVCMLFCNLSFAQVPASQVLRTQEVIEKEKELRKEIYREEKVFVKKIMLKGVNLLNQDRIKDIILPFQKKWLEKKDIQQIIESVKQAYKEKGYSEELVKISYQIIKNKYLEIDVDEPKSIK